MSISPTISAPRLAVEVRTLSASIRMYAVDPSLAPFVDELYVASFDAVHVGAVAYRRFPEAVSHLLFVIGQDRGSVDLLHCGPHQRLLGSTLIDRARVIVSATLRPFAATAVLGPSVVAAVGHFVDLTHVLGDIARRLRDDLVVASHPDVRAHLLTGFIVRQLRATSARSRPLHLCARLLGAELPDSVAQISDDLGLGTRQVHRLFVDACGLTPKQFLRMRRFRRALDASLEPRRRDWAQIALASGYCDQSHLIQEFGAFVDDAPDHRDELLRSRE